MMKLEEFADAVLTAVKEKADGAFSAWITTVTKNNGVKLTGISTTILGSNSGPCVYLDGYYEEYRQGDVEISGSAEDVYRRIMRHRNDLEGINTADFLRWDVIRYNIYAKLVNAEMNREMLGTVPHRHLLDLAVIYYIKVDGTTEGKGIMSVIIRNNYMEMWGQNEESLYQMAVSNMRTEGEPLFEDMAAVLQCAMPGGADWFGSGAAKVGMYVLTNRSKMFGAAEILDGETLRGISEKLSGDFIVLPSSVHETIILSSDNAPEYPKLADMVCEVNATQVDAEDRLSDHVYRYDRSEGVLKVAA